MLREIELRTRRVVILASGRVGPAPFVREAVNPGDFLICADGGAAHARRAGLVPHLVIGDGDSLPPDTGVELRRAGVEFITFPPEKDKTDTHLALDWARGRGARELLLLGVLGSRLDQALATMFLLPPLVQAGVQVRILDPEVELRLTAGDLELAGGAGQIVSLLPLTPTVSGVTTAGLYYPLQRARLLQSDTRGVSNYMTGDRARVTVENGVLLVTLPRISR